jgi:hypothetical protein
VQGKGVSDAIGGSVKCKVLYGKDIPNALVFVQKMQDCKIDISLVKEKKVLEEKKKLLQTEQYAVPGILKIHQVIARSPGKILYRNLSCDYRI